MKCTNSVDVFPRFLGQIDKGCEDLTDGNKLQSYTNLNFNSMVLLNAAFVRLKKKSANEHLRTLVKSTIHYPFSYKHATKHSSVKHSSNAPLIYGDF